MIHKFSAMIDSLCLCIIGKFFRTETITGPDGTPYLTRYHILNNKKWWSFSRKLYIHNILRSDFDRDPHCHPWNFVSILLKGSYKEYNRIETKFGEEIIETEWPRLSVVQHNAADAHRLELENGPVWTLVFVGPKIRDWGFYTPSGFVPNEEYIKAKHGDDFMM